MKEVIDELEKLTKEYLLTRNNIITESVKALKNIDDSKIIEVLKDNDL